MPVPTLCVPRGISSPNLPVLTLHPHLARPTQFSGTFPGRAGNKAWFYDSCVNTGWIALVHPASWKPQLPPQRPHRLSASQSPRGCREPLDTLLSEHLESPRERREQKAGCRQSESRHPATAPQPPLLGGTRGTLFQEDPNYLKVNALLEGGKTTLT